MIKKSPYLDILPKSKPITDHFYNGNNLPIEMWDRETVLNYQEDALKDILNHAYNNSEYYKSNFDKSNVKPKDFKDVSDLDKFPFLEKAGLRGEPWKLLSVPMSEVSQIHVSTGTTSNKLGDHIYSLFTWDELYVDELAINSELIANCSADDIVTIALPYEMSSSGVSFHRSFQNYSGATVVNAGKGGFYSDPKKTLIMMKDLKSTILITTPTYALYLSEIANDLGIDPKNDLNINKIWLTGEGCSISYRKRLEKVWDSPCYLFYGSLEGGPIGVECKEQNGYHMVQGHVYIEILDPKTGKPVEDGEQGEVCITSLTRRAMPIIRYKTQDIGYIEKSVCDCSALSNKLILRGRNQDQLDVGGKKISPYFIEELLFRMDEVGNNYQLVIEDNQLTINVEASKSTLSKAETEVKIKENIGKFVPGIKDVCIKDYIPRTTGKTQRVFYK